MTRTPFRVADAKDGFRGLMRFLNRPVAQRRVLDLVTAAWFIYSCLGLFEHYSKEPLILWPDAHIYFRATEAWIAGANPWLVSFAGIGFGAPPPALLLNLPLLPFGETVAVAAWAGAGFGAIVILLRRFRLPFWWMFFYPIAEGWTGGSPDVTLAALVYLGGGAIAALVKAYSIPALLSERRWHAVAIGVLATVVTIPLLPWRQFIDSLPVILNTFDQAAFPNSAWGQPGLMVIAAAALVLLGLRRGLALFTPALIAQQPHYALFSMAVVSRSRILALFINWPMPGAAAWGVILFAAHEWWLLRRSRRPGPGSSSGATRTASIPPVPASAAAASGPSPVNPP